MDMIAKGALSAESNLWTKERAWFYNRRYSEATVAFDDFDLRDYLKSNQEHLQAFPMEDDAERGAGEEAGAPEPSVRESLDRLRQRKSSGITQRKGSAGDYLDDVKEEMRRLREQNRKDVIEEEPEEEVG